MKNKNQNQNTNNNENQNPNYEQPMKTNYGYIKINATPRLVLPLMKTPEDAKQLCELEQDNVYMSIFMIQCWLGHAQIAIGAEYAEKKDPRTRSLQSGQTIRSFMETVGYIFCSSLGKETDYSKLNPYRIDSPDFPHFLAHIWRFAQFEDPMADLLREALNRYLTEHGGPARKLGAEHFNDHPVATFLRICDWLDSVLHFANHMLWHLQPEAFDPDPEKRELFTLGSLQRNFDTASEVEKAHWQWHFGDAIKQYAGSPKLSALAAGFNSTIKDPRSTNVWTYRDVDTSVIALWPLVERHNWTYADLLKTIRPNLKRPNAYPCNTEQNLATHCNLLGLRKSGKGTSASGDPAGADIARRLLNIKPQS